MNIDHTRITAELRANVCGRTSWAKQVLRRGGSACAVACMLACSAVAVLAPAHAQDRGGFRKDDLQQQSPRDDRGDRNNQRQDAPRYEQRDQRGDDARRQQQQQERVAEAQRRSGRLTADERRDLRRQINEAGVDLYPNTPRR